MNLLLSLIVGVLFTGGIYFVLRRSLAKVIMGLIMLSHGANLLIFTIGRVTRGIPPIIEYGEKTITGPFAEPLPQALILTAIVISFGVQSFAIVLFKRAYEAVKTDDINRLNTTDRL
jgi:multicomponent Na+:H+ antiporter subunit C